MAYQLIIAEKPAASEKIATALADAKPILRQINKVPYYELTRNKKKIVVTCAVGHLYSLAEKKKSWEYPAFDLEWKESHAAKRGSEFTKKYLNVIKKLAKNANEFIVACDYDIEGEVIGLNVLRFACKQKDAQRMKFSTLTKDDLIVSYDEREKHLDWDQANAGETRHFLDYFWGISMSRALMMAIKAAGAFKAMSSGRVQGPTLKIIIDKEREIKKFKPTPFWEIELTTDKLNAWHKKGKLTKKPEAEKIIKNTKGKQPIVKLIKKTKSNISPGVPFDLTTLQMEAYKVFKITPKETLQLAQQLYTAGLISYPRTSSQKLPPQINYKKILKKLAKQKAYTSYTEKILKTKLVPRQGGKSDAAHPAIYPTGDIKKLQGRLFHIYDLIARRFLACFAPDAVRETQRVDLDLNKEIFVASGAITIEPGWFDYYKYARFKEQELPKLKEGEKLKKKKVELHEEETKPPKRYSPASIIKELEKKNLGTKATRAAILDSLYQRYYIQNTQIEATDLGMATIKTLEKYSPEILDEALTRHFEQGMEEIRERKKIKDEVLDEAKKILVKIFDKFRKHEKDIGKALLDASRTTQKTLNVLSDCPECKKGKLVIRKGRFGLFVACNAYPKCKTTFSLPQGLPKPTKLTCKECNFPLVTIIRGGKRPFNYCINKKCPKRLRWIAEQEKKKAEEEKEENKKEKKENKK